MRLDEIDLLDLDRFQKGEHHEMFRTLRGRVTRALARGVRTGLASGT